MMFGAVVAAGLIVYSFIFLAVTVRFLEIHYGERLVDGMRDEFYEFIKDNGLSKSKIFGSYLERYEDGGEGDGADKESDS